MSKVNPTFGFSQNTHSAPQVQDVLLGPRVADLCDPLSSAGSLSPDCSFAKMHQGILFHDEETVALSVATDSWNLSNRVVLCQF